MNWILDLVVVLILFFSVLRMARRGFIRSIIMIVGSVVAFYVASFVAGFLAQQIYISWIRPSLISSIETQLAGYSSGNLAQTVSSIWNSMPGILQTGAGNLGVTNDTVGSAITGYMQYGAQTAAPHVADTIARTVVVDIIRVILTMIIFFLLLMIVRKLAKIFNRVANLPVLGLINHFLGGVLGLVYGGIMVLLLASLVALVLLTTQNGIGPLTAQSVQASHIFYFFYQYAPLSSNSALLLL